jgi:hypothetical protein
LGFRKVTTGCFGSEREVMLLQGGLASLRGTKKKVTQAKKPATQTNQKCQECKLCQPDK